MALLTTLSPATDGYLGCPLFMPQAVAASGYLCSAVIEEAPGRVSTGSTRRWVRVEAEKHNRLRQEDDEITAIIIAMTITGELE